MLSMLHFVVQNWGVEVSMAMLLVAAFQAVNVLSLVYMLCIALGMGLAEKARRAAWRLLALPVLSLLLLWQYAVWVGWPPFLTDPLGRNLSYLDSILQAGCTKNL